MRTVFTAGALAVVTLISLSPSAAGSGPGESTVRSPAATRTATGAQYGALPRWLLGHDWERIPTRRHVVALTFDAGSNAAGLPSIRRTLGARRVPATFFLTGQWARGHPGQARALAARYRIGNHSMTHPHFTALTNRQIRSQITRATTAIRNVCGVSPRPLFRFPFGDRNRRTITAVNNAGYVPVRWTVDTLGWEGTRAGITVGSIVRRVLANLRPGEIVLMHVGANPDDHSTLDANALPRVISALRARGYSFVTLNALLAAR
ncbi:MAG TPA: polysaccharide deacetylase family protein [Jatrophihabitans sp.]|jgi:peptidoglycan/xylan/chitin deacetylase (PgdA/CDA1 family)